MYCAWNNAVTLGHSGSAQWPATCDAIKIQRMARPPQHPLPQVSRASQQTAHNNIIIQGTDYDVSYQALTGAIPSAFEKHFTKPQVTLSIGLLAAH